MAVAGCISKCKVRVDLDVSGSVRSGTVRSESVKSVIVKCGCKALNNY